MKYELDGLDSYDRETLKVELRRAASLLTKRPITRAEFDKIAKVSSSTIVRRFGTWADALNAAGLHDTY